MEALLERSRRHPNLKNRADLETEDAVLAMPSTTAHPRYLGSRNGFHVGAMNNSG